MRDGHRNGRYVVTNIRLLDSVGNSATYYADGTVRVSDASTGPATHSVDFAATPLTITGAPLPVPQIASLSIPSLLVRGRTNVLTFVAHPGPAPVTIDVEAQCSTPGCTATFHAKVTSATTAAVALPATAVTGDDWWVTKITVTDVNGAWMRYHSADWRECSSPCGWGRAIAWPTAGFDVVGVPEKVSYGQFSAGDRSGHVDVQAPNTAVAPSPLTGW